ncbi:Fur family transcriptional regulator [Microvirga solisilvae]|uniref:Fur family transcriptional regulator n=1 Tax=Microvirga solisilvae TaxID=2919498 RepID=UPI001FAF21C4|nr:Fur family transcriptional regulator [Microvirga solisilvae]
MTQTVVQQPTSKAALISVSLAHAENLCRANRARLTPIRRRVLETLHNSNRPLGAYDLAAALAPQGRRMAPITVYRALEFLIEQGLAHRLASLNAYVASSQANDGRGTAAFLICEACGSVSEVSSPELHDAVSNLHKSHSFSPRARLLELTGRCAHC